MLHSLELLAPAANADIAVQAVVHGADAVYMGATSHGARKSACNSLEDISRVVDFAHRFRAKVYVTVNTIVYENELFQVEKLCRDLYRIGVDALIVQDMSLLRLNLPPIALHASTQCDIRTPEKARFLQEAGFSQLVLARELTLGEIKGITQSVTIPVECFVHGALCVSYSGRCHASCAVTGRSANRGECAQICRLPFSLRDSSGNVLAREKHLLSLRDFNASAKLPDLIEAGVSSFKIEGRLKEIDYVKNITAKYNGLLNDYIENNPGRYCRSSFGKSAAMFAPAPEKSFNRGFTDYFLSERRPQSIASILTPKSMGEIITDVSMLHNGDGISYFDNDGQYCGVNVNKVESGRIVTGRKVNIPKGAEIHRTHDLEWQKTMSKESAVRKLNLHVKIDDKGVSASDERGVVVRVPLDVTRDIAKSSMDYRKEFAKLGGTPYVLASYESSLDSSVFIPRSEIGALRRRLVELLDNANLANYRYDLRRSENLKFPYPYKALDFRDNVANSVAERFYRDHGVETIVKAMEASESPVAPGTVVMTTRHCILRELGMCKRDNAKSRGRNSDAAFKEPLMLTSGNRRFRLKFDCRNCEMQLFTE